MCSEPSWSLSLAKHSFAMLATPASTSSTAHGVPVCWILSKSLMVRSKKHHGHLCATRPVVMSKYVKMIICDSIARSHSDMRWQTHCTVDARSKAEWQHVAALDCLCSSRVQHERRGREVQGCGRTSSARECKGLITKSAFKRLIANQHLKQRGSKSCNLLIANERLRSLELPRPLAKRAHKSLEDHNEKKKLQDAQGFHTWKLMRLTLTSSLSLRKTSDSSSSTSNIFKPLQAHPTKKEKEEGWETEQSKEEQQRQQVFEGGCQNAADKKKQAAAIRSWAEGCWYGKAGSW